MTRRLHTRTGVLLSYALKGAIAGAALPICSIVAGCGQEEGAASADPQVEQSLAAGEAFVAVPRAANTARINSLRQALDTNPDVGSAGSAPDFYLAINKSLLGKKWFLSAFLKQYFPGAVSSGAAITLGTKVVSFRVQNGRVYVMDVDDRKVSSDTFNPDLAVEAYPVVSGYAPFDQAGGSSNYVLFDPARGLNRFGVLSDAFAGGSKPEHFNIEASFVQRFRKIADGATFEQVFTGYGEIADPNASSGGEPLSIRSSGTLGIGLRQYQEPADFAQVPFIDFSDPMNLKALPQHYFQSDPYIIPNTGETTYTATKWNVTSAKSAPIKWVISDKIDLLKRDSRFSDLWAQDTSVKPPKWIYEASGDHKLIYDVEGALIKAVTNWNQAFGYEIMQARKAKIDESFGDDDTNYMIFDPDGALGAAFAQWRTNPNTGQIRGASVYFDYTWLDAADQFSDDAMLTGAGGKRQLPAGLDRGSETLKQDVLKYKHGQFKTKAGARPRMPSLRWMGMPEKFLCAKFAPGHITERPKLPGSVMLTKKQKVEQYLTHVALHEIGHTLGLRHNFKGSMEQTPAAKPPQFSNSVMEYILDGYAYNHDIPGSHDTDAIRYLQGFPLTGLPTIKPSKHIFCTDDDVSLDPDCTPYDDTTVPLEQLYGAEWADEVDTAWLQDDDFFGLFIAIIDGTFDSLIGYVQAGTPTQRLRAWHILMDKSYAPTPAATEAMYPGYASRADYVAYFVFQALYLTLPADRGRFTSDPPADAALLKEVIPQARENLINSDKGRFWDTRAVMVDVLKKLQSDDALRALSEARSKISTAGLSGSNLWRTQDLLSRIDKALNPYFN